MLKNRWWLNFYEDFTFGEIAALLTGKVSCALEESWSLKSLLVYTKCALVN